AGERAEAAGDRVGKDDNAGQAEPVGIAVGADCQTADLRRQARRDVVDEAAAGEGEQGLVVAAHAGRAAARENQARHRAVHRPSPGGCASRMMKSAVRIAAIEEKSMTKSRG